MKSKEISTISKPFSAKMFVVFLLTVLFVLAPFAIVNVNAEQEDFTVENRNMTNELSDLLAQESNGYTERDVSDEKSVSKGVATVINIYRKQLIDLQVHKDVSKRLLTAEAELAYSKGQAAGRLAWIYYYNSIQIKDTAASARLKTAYEGYLTQTDAHTDADVLDASANVMCTELNRAVYREKIQLLKQNDDSVASCEIIEVALRSVDSFTDFTLFADELSVMYSELEGKLVLQRSRDVLMKQLKSLFAIIRPEEAFDSNEAVLFFNYNLKNATDVADMNSAMRDVLAELTSPSGNSVYVALFSAKLNEAVASEAAKASHDGTCVDVMPLFISYRMDFGKAKTKDEIAKIILSGEDVRLMELEAEFNQADGFVEACTSTAELEKELIRAEYRKKLYDLTSTTREKVNIILGSYAKESFVASIDAVYLDIDKQLSKLSEQASTFEIFCQNLLSRANDSLSQVLVQAKTERYLQDHRMILTKPKDSLELGDEIFLRSAISDFILLESEVKSALGGQVVSIAEKYNIVVSYKIKSLMPEDALYLDLCQKICDELKNIPLENIAVFYNDCDLIYNKAQALCEIVSYYRDAISAPNYQSYNEVERTELSAIPTDAAQRLCQIKTDADFSTSLNQVLQSSKTLIEQACECARVRVAARDSESVTVQTLLSEARSKIRSTTDKNEMVQIADNAIFKINRELVKDEITARSDKYEYLVKEMKFLSSSDIATICASIRAYKNSGLADAALAQNPTVLTFVWEGYAEAVEKLLSEANIKDLEGARTSYSELLQKELDSFSSKVGAMVYLASGKGAEYISGAGSIGAKFKTDIVLCQSSAEVSAAYTQTLEQMQQLLDVASKENLSNYKEILCAELDKLGNNDADYSVENYNKILQTIADGKKRLDAATDISLAKSVYQSTVAAVDEINTLIDDAKEAAIADLDAILEACRKNAGLYSQTNVAGIESLYNDAVKKISAYERTEDRDAVYKIKQDAIFAMKSVRRNMVYSSEAAYSIGMSGVQYPANYDFVNGYWGSVYSPDGILYGAVLKIGDLSDKAKLKEIQKLVRRAAKQNSFNAYGGISSDKLKMLKKSVVALGIDLSLSECASGVGAYTLSMLLPSGLTDENILGIVFTDENNNVEFYNCERTGALLTVDLSHFSAYYIVCEETVNLYPLIIFLTVVLIMELVVLALALLWHRYRKRKEGENNMFPLLSAFGAFSSPAALRIEPANGVGVAVVLGVAVIAIGCGIAFLAKLELKSVKRSGRCKNTVRVTPCEPQEDIGLLKEKKEVPILCATGTQLLNEAEKYEFEEEIYSDTENSLGGVGEVPSGVRKAEINLDVIETQFEAGELVNLELLKKKRLVSKRTEYVKILARGSLTKPLVVEAHDFSRAAEEMLKAIGGEAIRVGIK